jgi:hypothetical protein
MNRRISRPLLGTDFLIVACLAVVAYCVIAGRWPAVVIFALGGAIFCGISPRMTGPFGFSGGGVWLGGSFDDSAKVIIAGRVKLVDPEAQPDEEAPPSSTRPSGD